MKAILVVDLPDNDIDKYYVEYTLMKSVGDCGYWIDGTDYALSKPMPNEREEKDHYDFGWNDCVRVLNDDYNLCKLG